jgi:hypothetical protein
MAGTRHISELFPIVRMVKTRPAKIEGMEQAKLRGTTSSPEDKPTIFANGISKTALRSFTNSMGVIPFHKETLFDLSS